MDKVVDYSSDDSGSEDQELEKKETPNHSQDLKDTQQKKRKLPSLPSDIQEKFIKKPTLPDPAFYEMNRIVLPNKYPGLTAMFPFINIKPSLTQYDLLQDVIQESKLYLKLHGQSVRLNSLLCNELDVNFPLHVSMNDSTFHTKQQRHVYNKALSTELGKLTHRSESSNLLTFEKVQVLPNLDQSHMFLVMSLSQQSKDGLKEIYDLIQQITKDASDDGIPKILTDSPISHLSETHSSIARCFVIDPETDQPYQDKHFTKDSKILKELNELLEAVEIDPKLNFTYDKISLLHNYKDIVSYKIGK